MLPKQPSCTGQISSITLSFINEDSTKETTNPDEFLTYPV